MTGIASGYRPLPPYDLVQLHYVRTIAACGSMTAAARMLRVSQPTLSNAVRALERRLGAPLFLRDPRGVIATSSGHTLAQAADAVFALLRQTDEQLRGIEAQAVGRFAIGCYHSFGAIVLPRAVMAALAARAPGIELSLWDGIGPEIVGAVADRTVQFGLGVASAAPSRLPAELVVVPLFRDVMAVVRAKRRVSGARPLFHVPRIGLSERVVEALRARGQLPERVVACGDLELVKSLVASGAGIGVLPWRVAVQGALRLVGADLPYEVDTGCLYYRADLHRTRGAMIVHDAIVEHGRALDALALPHGVAPLAGA